MKINSLDIFNFEGARANYVANADNHANLRTLGDLYGTIKDNKEDIFESYNPKDYDSTLNIYANAGDFFVNPSQKGWLTKGKTLEDETKNLTNGDVQADFFNKFVSDVQALTLSNGHFAANYTPGNHDFDGGDKMFYDIVNEIGRFGNVDTIVSNFSFVNSPALKKDFDKQFSHFYSKKIYTIPDDKGGEPHKLLALGVTIPSMEFYNPELLKETKFLEHTGIKDVKIEEDDLRKTFLRTNNMIKRFKDENPKGAVVLASHTGRRISEMFAKNVPDIDIILDGHGHTDETTIMGKTHILSLGQDNQFFKTFRINFDDDGNFTIDDIKKYDTKKHNDNDLAKKLDNDYAKDIMPILETPKGLDFSYDKSIRYSNSHLANVLTSMTKNALNEVSDEKIDIMGIQSSIIRGGLKNGSTNMDILKIFDGVSEDLSGVMTGKVLGSTLATIVYENIRDNLAKPDRNTIIHWSDLRINRSAMQELKDLDFVEFVQKCLGKPLIEIRNDKGDFVPLNYDKTYTIAIADKYLKKNDIEMPRRIRDNFKPTGETYNTLFNKALVKTDYNIPLSHTFIEDRIV